MKIYNRTFNREQYFNLEKLSAEVESRKNLLAFMINNDMDSSNSFTRYQEEYTNFYQKYEQEKKVFQKAYIDPILLENNIDAERAKWNLNFDDGEVTITYYET